MSYRIDAGSADCYEGTSCLVNKFGIRDEDKLAEVEAAITFAKATELEVSPLPGRFDDEHYRAIHRYLFAEIYTWAGEIRTVDISKKGTRFVPAAQIPILAEQCFSRLERLGYLRGLPRDAFVKSVTDFYSVTNMLHPFREGNGRAQRVFITQLVRNAGYDIRFSEIDTDELMIATIQSANGVTDRLEQLLDACIH
jgi:cell filamentation protein